MRTRFDLTLAAIIALAGLAACGTAGLSPGGSGQLAEQREIAGMKLGGYEVVRFNAAGVRDASLNRTLALRLVDADTLVIGIRDDAAASVALEVRYDGRQIHPDRAVYHGLLGGEADVLSASFLTQRAGVAGLGQACLGDYRPGRLSGDFVTVHFARGASHTTSRAPGRAVDAEVGGLPNLEVNSEWVSQSITLKWYAGFHQGDGDQNGEVNIADITPIGQHFNETWQGTGASWDCLPADYDGNTLVNLSDISSIGQNYASLVWLFAVFITDNTISNGLLLRSVGWLQAEPADESMPDYSLGRIFKSWTLDYNYVYWDGIVMADENGDGIVQFHILPYDNSSPAVAGSSAAFDVSIGGNTGTDVININGYDLRIIGATGGGGAGDVFAGPGGDMAGAVIANRALTLRLNSIMGTYQGVPFDSTTELPTPEGMTQADYDAAFNAVRDALAWYISSGGDVNERHTSSWFTPDTAYAGTGDPGAGKVFPDYDPESTGANAQGVLSTDLPLADKLLSDDVLQLDVNVPAPIAYNGLRFEVGPDPAAPLITGYFEDPALNAPMTELLLGLETPVYMSLTWGSGGSPPLDDTHVALDLIQIDTATGTPITTVNMVWTDNHTPIPGEFHIEPGIDPDHWIFSADVAGGMVQISSHYLFRLGAGLDTSRIWETINLPQMMLDSGGYDGGLGLPTYPGAKTGGIGCNHDQLLIMYDEPIVRRDGRLIIDQVAGTVTPENQAGFEDILKTADPGWFATEFIVSMDASLAVYPRIVFQANTLDSSKITDIDDPDAVPGIGVLERRFDRMVIDFMAITPEGDSGDPEGRYAFKIFNFNKIPVGSGSMTISPLRVDPIQVTGINWGINVWNREDFLISNRAGHYANHTVNADTMSTATPDVLWVEFNGGHVFDFDEYWNDQDFPPPAQRDNVAVVLTDVDGISGSMTLPLELAIIGVGATGNYIAIHHLDLQSTDGYLDWAGGPAPWPGILAPGHSYTVQLDDPLSAGIDWTYADLLTVSGTNPNG